MTHEEFAKQLLAEADAFIDAMTIYSRALFKFIHEREVEMREGEKIPKVIHGGETAKSYNEKKAMVVGSTPLS